MKTIKQLREGRGWTQLKLANELGITPSTIYKWEAGRNEPGAMQLRAVARVFGVSSDDIELVDEQVSKKAA
jgi:transcriptional regulator with XRE-family HTH domain